MKKMDTKVIIVGASLVVVGAFAALGGTFSMMMTPLPVIGFNALQIGGAIVALVGVGTLVGVDPLGLKQAASATAF
jgi:hypothetical protein